LLSGARRKLTTGSATIRDCGRTGAGDRIATIWLVRVGRTAIALGDQSRRLLIRAHTLTRPAAGPSP
jgi:hypothetical protein